MSALEIIKRRKSVRHFLEKDVSDEDIKTILKAGMSGPSALNSRDWHFIVIKDKDTLKKIKEGCGKSAASLETANFAIIPCGDFERTSPVNPEVWVVDVAMASQNMMLAAEELGIGSCYIGAWTKRNYVDTIMNICGIDEDLTEPLAVISFGYEDISVEVERFEKPEWEESQVHYEKW